ncbi:YbjN domain-containing protein [Candidatus Eisenbacteria bacterium]|uniref:YbjN domain-containing protein n=1 Tax=Eiseniibacteriota bacterium TaxID=2212470 RepID=A0ABV6YLP2_UNCEI
MQTQPQGWQDRGSVFEAMCRFFDEDDWNYQQIETQNALLMECSGEHGTWRCLALARDEMDQFVFYSIREKPVPEAARMQVAELLTRVNYGMAIGNFEIDLADGELRFKTSLDVSESEVGITPEMVGHHVYFNVLVMDRYLPALESVIAGEATPEEAALVQV